MRNQFLAAPMGVTAPGFIRLSAGCSAAHRALSLLGDEPISKKEWLPA